MRSQQPVVAPDIAASSVAGVTGGSKPSNQMSSVSWSSAHCSWNSGVVVAYQRASRHPRLRQASVTQADTVRWSGWPVMPSGPKVTTVSGRNRSSSEATWATPDAYGTCGREPSL